MKILVHAPFGTASEETGLLYLVLKYLRRTYPEITQLRCGGTFSICDRDADTFWKREVSTCFRCIQDQKDLAQWGELGTTDLSSHLIPEELIRTRKWIAFAKTEELLALRYEDIHPYPLVRGSFRVRFGVEEPNLSNKHHEQIIRRQLLSAVRAILSTRRYLARGLPDLALIVKGDDFISASVGSECDRAGVATSRFRWDIESRQVHVSHSARPDRFLCSLVLNGLPTMRTDMKTWPPEILTIVHEVSQFLGIDPNQAPRKAALK